MKTVLVSGQSNAVGRGTGGPLFNGIDSRVRVWNNVNPLGANGSAFVSAASARTAGTFENTNTNNFGIWFCHRLALVRDDDVRMTMVARGATTIAEWATGAAVPMLAEMKSVWTATGQGPADVFLWHQGEGNTGTAYGTYKTAFLTLLANLTSAGIINANTTVIVGGLSEDNQSRINFNVGALQALATENAQISYAPSDGLSSYDGTHFNGSSLYTLGAERYFAAYAEEEGIIMADLFALVNEGGTPGSPGTGANKLYNLLNLALIGMEKKDTTIGAAFNGTRPIDKMLTAGMVAAGAIVEYGTNANGSYVRFEGGLQVCWIHTVLVFVSSNFLQYTWTFPKAFISNPFVTHAMQGDTVTNMVSGKRVATYVDTNGSLTTASTLRLGSSAGFTGGDETMGTKALAVGFWKV